MSFPPSGWLNPARMQSMPHDQVNWAALAQQWIAMRHTAPGDGAYMHGGPFAQPVPGAVGVPMGMNAMGAKQPPPPPPPIPAAPRPRTVIVPPPMTAYHRPSMPGMPPPPMGRPPLDPVPIYGRARPPQMPPPPEMFPGYRASMQQALSQQHVQKPPLLPDPGDLQGRHNDATESQYASGHWEPLDGPEQDMDFSNVKPLMSEYVPPPRSFHSEEWSGDDHPQEHYGWRPFNHDSDSSHITMEQRRALPAWLREGLEQMEREKLKKVEIEAKTGKREKAREERRVAKGLGKFDSDSEGSDTDEKLGQSPSGAVDSENRTAISDSSPILDRDDLTGSRDRNRSASPVDPEVLRQQMVDLLRRWMTETLLESTENVINDVAAQCHSRARHKAKPKVLAQSNALAAISALGGDDDLSSGNESADEHSDPAKSDTDSDTAPIFKMPIAPASTVKSTPKRAKSSKWDSSEQKDGGAPAGGRPAGEDRGESAPHKGADSGRSVDNDKNLSATLSSSKADSGTSELKEPGSKSTDGKSHNGESDRRHDTGHHFHPHNKNPTPSSTSTGHRSSRHRSRSPQRSSTSSRHSTRNSLSKTTSKRSKSKSKSPISVHSSSSSRRSGREDRDRDRGKRSDRRDERRSGASRHGDRNRRSRSRSRSPRRHRVKCPPTLPNDL